MKVIHELTIHGRCPVDDAIDTYEVTVEAARTVKVEDILGAVAGASAAGLPGGHHSRRSRRSSGVG
jgi:hypothetical protein